MSFLCQFGLLLLSGGLLASDACAAPVLIDLGRSDGIHGNLTVGPDENGRFWNNLTAPLEVAPGLHLTGLIDAANTPSSIGLSVSSGWKTDGRGGLLAPQNELLGELAIRSATEDYFFVEGAKASLTITGLDRTKRYTLRMFGSRSDTEVGKSTYRASSAGRTKLATLQTSGAGIGANGEYNGNDDELAVITDIQPDIAGEILLETSTAAGTCSYLGVLEITESKDSFPVIAARPPAAIARWVEQDQLEPVPPGALVFVGSSSIRRWESLSEVFADYRVIQRGYGGSFIAEMDTVAGYILRPYEPSGIVIWSGTNDVKVGGHSASRVLEDFRIVLGSIRSQQPKIPVFYLGMAPTPAYATDTDADFRRRESNLLIKATCDADSTLHYIDLPGFFENVQAKDPANFKSYYSDDTHFNRKGYAVWKRLVRPVVEGVLAPNKSFVANPDTLVVGESLLFDFGPADGKSGEPTTGVDVRGNHWNNWHPTDGGGTVTAGEHLAGLVKSDGTKSGIGMTITGDFKVGGKENGGLSNPEETLLGDLAVESATEDYFYCTGDDLYDRGNDDVPGGLMIRGLNPRMSYELKLFGTRNSLETRITEYRVSGVDTFRRNLQTSGSGIGSNGSYDGNDDEVVSFSELVPDAFGQLFIDLTATQCEFAYLGAMKITAKGTRSGPDGQGQDP